MYWKTIETAPKDGTEIMVGWPDSPKRQFPMRWNHQSIFSNASKPPLGRWEGKCNWSEGPRGPTHWRELRFGEAR